jgi:hypothetical protein
LFEIAREGVRKWKMNLTKHGMQAVS